LESSAISTLDFSVLPLLGSSHWPLVRQASRSKRLSADAGGVVDPAAKHPMKSAKKQAKGVAFSPRRKKLFVWEPNLQNTLSGNDGKDT